jgi:3-hydroxybutyryl-CoA dehydrogenase
MQKIAVVGAGLMGHGIAQVFALQGYSVGLTDISDAALAAAVDNVRANLNLLAGQGIIAATDVAPALERIETAVDLGQAVDGADFVVEAVVENLEIKQNIFRDLDARCPDNVILATNTSVISITEIAARTGHTSRVVGTHFWNPPYLIPLVEVVRGEQTDERVMDRTIDILKAVGKHPVRVNKDVPGFVANRLQHALWREAISIVEHGIADAATVDECVKYGFGLRLPILGPMENIDLVGTDLTLAIHDYLLKHLERSPDPSPMLKAFVARGDLGFKTGRGFQPWSAEKVAATHSHLKTYLLKATAQPKPKGGNDQ